jgi:small subunit ribosomal protein S16
MVGILEPQYRIGQIQGQVVKANSAVKSLIPEVEVDLGEGQGGVKVENLEGGTKEVNA